MICTLIISIVRGTEPPETIKWTRAVDDPILHDIKAALDALLDGPIPKTEPPRPPIQAPTTLPSQDTKS